MAPSATNDTNGSTPTSKINFTTFRNVINNKLVDTATHHQGINPATKEKLWDVPVATSEDLDEAVKAARTAFKKWKNVPQEERVRCVAKFADLIEANLEGFIDLLTTEQGKPVCETLSTVQE